MMNLKRAAGYGGIAVTAVLLSSRLGGCVGYHSYPPTPEQRARESMGERAPVDVMVRALERVLVLHPSPSGSFAINLPMTTPPETYADVAHRVGGEPLSPSASSLPIYHIAGVRVRNGKAWVDVVWPAGAGIERSTTVWLEGGMQPWAVTRVQEWNSGVIPTPEHYYIMRESDAPLTPEAPVTDAPSGSPVPTPESAEPAPGGSSPDQPEGAAEPG